MDVETFLNSITPEEMDRIEAQYVVRWEREALVHKHQIANTLAAAGVELELSEVEMLAPNWFPEE